MFNNSSKTQWNVFSTGIALLAGMTVRTILKKGYQAIKDEAPPANPASSKADWTDALIWTAATGAAVGVGKMVAKRGAVAAWEKTTGDTPPGIKS